jgi:hypothetical protein
MFLFQYYHRLSEPDCQIFLCIQEDIAMDCCQDRGHGNGSCKWFKFTTVLGFCICMMVFIEA